MRRYIPLVAAGVALLSGAAVLQLKYAVQEQSSKVKAIARQIHRDEEAIRVLKAEWSYKTTPAVLQDRSLRFLALMPPHSDQIIVSPQVIPFRINVDAEVDPDPGVLLSEHSNRKKKNRSDRSNSKRGFRLQISEKIKQDIQAKPQREEAL
ncbi:hypothetical protein [Kordiimonas sp. SCSIO 12610]|uniref:cell division protein FtsL n=1 Tax=Kordiimonas sp. SCSIO 12610 TaxID=2829597 RepID=UPI00210DF28D|nr:hypothetical protein [Kordiimonas sp. SCSIO 12610]UTW56404.1 hypothetical protein KFF44_05735 [Kordiimonas sp. SCSIO 12610]